MTLVDTLSIVDLLNLHLLWYPLMEVQDVYKLLYQGVMGSEHLLSSQTAYTVNLENEYAATPTDPDLQLFEPVRSDGKLFRLNLSRLKAKRTGLKSVIAPLRGTAGVIRGTESELRRTWESFVELCLQGYVNKFDFEQVERFTQKLSDKEFPTFHHSEQYRRFYQPAYRLIAGEFIASTGLVDED